MAKSLMVLASNSALWFCSSTSWVRQNGHHRAERWNITRAFFPALTSLNVTALPRWSGKVKSGSFLPVSGPLGKTSLEGIRKFGRGSCSTMNRCSAKVVFLAFLTVSRFRNLGIYWLQCQCRRELFVKEVESPLKRFRCCCLASRTVFLSGVQE